MKQYFAKVTSCYWTEKNALHGALLDMIKGMDCTLFSESELEDFVKALYDSVDILNTKFKRCKPFKLEIMSEVEKHYYIPGVFHISIYEVARGFATNNKNNFAKIIQLAKQQVVVYKRNETKPLIALITRANQLELKAEADFNTIEERDAFYQKFDSKEYTNSFIQHCFGGTVE